MHGFVSSEKSPLSSEHLTKSDLWGHSPWCSEGDLCGLAPAAEKALEKPRLWPPAWLGVGAGGQRGECLLGSDLFSGSLGCGGAGGEGCLKPLRWRRERG